jgi:hypothetical protein
VAASAGHGFSCRLTVSGNPEHFLKYHMTSDLVWQVVRYPLIAAGSFDRGGDRSAGRRARRQRRHRRVLRIRNPFSK